MALIGDENMLFPIYQIKEIDIEKIEKGDLLSKGITAITGVLMVGDFGVSIDYKQKVVQMKFLPTRYIFKDKLKEQGGKISLFSQYQAELFWMFDITEKNVEINEKGYTCITLPMNKCVVGVVSVKG